MAESILNINVNTTENQPNRISNKSNSTIHSISSGGIAGYAASAGVSDLKSGDKPLRAMDPRTGESYNVSDLSFRRLLSAKRGANSAIYEQQGAMKLGLAAENAEATLDKLYSYRDDINNNIRGKIRGGMRNTINSTKVGISSISAGFSIYSQHKSIGYNLSGAEHSANTQSRKQQAAQFAVSVGVAGIVNPLLMPGVIGMKALQLAEQNSQKIFSINSSMVKSNILRDLLVKDTMERRF